MAGESFLFALGALSLPPLPEQQRSSPSLTNKGRGSAPPRAVLYVSRSRLTYDLGDFS